LSFSLTSANTSWSLLAGCHGIKFTPKISIFAPVGKPCVGLNNDLHLLELTQRHLSPCKVWEIKLSAPAVGAKIWCFCVSRLVCLRVGDIVQTSIVSWFICRFWCGFQGFFGGDCPFRSTREFLFWSL